MADTTSFEQRVIRIASETPASWQVVIAIVAEAAKQRSDGFRLHEIRLIFERPLALPRRRGAAPPLGEGTVP